jgi:hypothetical protein
MTISRANGDSRGEPSQTPEQRPPVVSIDSVYKRRSLATSQSLCPCLASAAG